MVLSSITDFKISAVSNPKSKRSANGETIYLCIDRKGRHFINLNLEKTPKSAWSGKSLKLVNNQYQYVEFHNRVIAREIHHLKEIIQDFFKRSEILTADKLKNFYLVKYQGKSIKGVNGTIFPVASYTITSYFEYSLQFDATSKTADDTRRFMSL